MPMRLCVVVITKNEEQHIERCLESVKIFADQCLVVDSGSTDRTVELAEAAGAKVLTNTWVNHATQFNWSIDRAKSEADWIMRLDADEIVDSRLAMEIKLRLPEVCSQTSGIFVSRRMKFLGQDIRWGGGFPIKVLRLFRSDIGRCENRWMDEHIVVSGPTKEFRGEIVDDNLKSLTWWTEKHNKYASREAVDLLNLEYQFMHHETIADLGSRTQSGVKRWVKESLYSRLPRGGRAFGYFIYRYFLRLGFLDGTRGTAFHFLQGFWYRYLVDIKIYEVKAYMQQHKVDVVSAINDVLGVDINLSGTATQTRSQPKDR